MPGQVSALFSPSIQGTRDSALDSAHERRDDSAGQPTKTESMRAAVRPDSRARGDGAGAGEPAAHSIRAVPRCGDNGEDPSSSVTSTG